jgi:predicted nucleic acid-binding protein
MKAVLLDTGPLVALLDRSESNHALCVERFATLDTPLVTCEAVLAEACYLLRKLPGAPAAVLENVRRGLLHVPYRVFGREQQLSRLMKKYQDLPMDFADACLVDLAGELGTGRVFTLDRDFQVYRWGRNRVFDSLLALT